jgi:hypothetical protein
MSMTMIVWMLVAVAFAGGTWWRSECIYDRQRIRSPSL